MDERHFKCESCHDADGGCDDCSKEEDIEVSDKEKSAYTVAELLGMDFPQMKIHNEKFLPLADGVLSMISGEGGVGKGFIGLQSAIRYLRDNKDDTALLWFAEDPLRVIAQRVKVLNGMDVADRMIIPTADPKTLSKKIDKFKNYGFILLDPLVYFYDGDNENDNNQASKFMKKLNDICIENNNVMSLIHHHNKMGGTRGASAFTDNCRLVYEIRRDEVAKEIKVELKKDNFQVSEANHLTINPQKIVDAETIGGSDNGKL